MVDTDSMPAVVDDNRFEFDNVATTIGGSAAEPYTVGFFNEDSGGGFSIWDPKDLGLATFESAGPTLFGGSTAMPSFLTGTFQLFAVGADQTLPADYSLTISAVPEPATWAMMLIGFAMVGAASRYRRRGVSVAFG